jgi:hypothetical protein
VGPLRNYLYHVSVRLSDEDKQRYERLLKRFGKLWRATKSEHFRELLKRLSEDLSFETKWDNPGAYYDEESPEESTEEPSEEPTTELR